MNDRPLRLYFEETGSGEPVVLLHGFGTSAYSWRHLVPALAVKHRVINVDLKGFGKSPRPQDGRYSIHDQAELICDLIESLDLDRLTLIGHSYGGGVALLTALRLNDDGRQRLKRLVLIDNIAYMQRLPFFIRLLRMPLIGWLGMSLLPAVFQSRMVLKRAYHDRSMIPADSVEEYAKPLREADGRYALARIVEQIIPDDIAELAEKYKTITQPALVIWGDDDRIVPIAVGERLHGDLPNSEFAVVPQCGHMPHEERAEAAISLIGTFLEHER